MIQTRSRPMTSCWTSLPSPAAGHVSQLPLRRSAPAGTSCRHILLARLSTRVGLLEPGDEVLTLCKEGQLDKAMHVLLQMDEQGSVASGGIYRSLLKACADRKALTLAKRVHAHLVKHGLDSATSLGEHVVSTFVKCGDLEDALHAFHKLPLRTVFSWTAIISGYTMSGQGRKALMMYQRMQEQGVQPNAYTFVSLLKACANLVDLEEGKRIHAEALQFVCESDLFLPNCLIDMYGKCGSVVDARDVFDGLPLRDVVSWTSMLVAYAQQGQPEEALQLYEKMLEEGVSPNSRTYVIVLQACGMLAGMEVDVVVDGHFILNCLERGKSIHAQAWGKGFETDVFVGNALISMYGRCGRTEDAWIVFDGLPHRNVVSWNAMLAAYIDHGRAEKGLQLYREMEREGVHPDSRTLVSLLQACGILAEREDGILLYGQSVKIKALATLRVVHADISRIRTEEDVILGNALVSAYQKCGSIADAKDVFDSLVQRDVVSWSAMVAAYSQQGQAEKALQLYERLREQSVSPNIRTFVSALQACSVLAEKEHERFVNEQSIRMLSLKRGKTLHAEVWRKGFVSNLFVCSTLVRMYGKCGSIVDARDVFDGLPQRDVVAWTGIVTAHVEQGQAAKALQFYEQMLEEGVSPDGRTFVSVLQACSLLAEEEDDNVLDGLPFKVKLLGMGKAVHADAHINCYASGVFLGSTLIDMYGKCGSIVDARNVFDELTHHNVVSWTAMIGAYVEQGEVGEALQLYRQMQKEGPSPDQITLVCILQACSKTGNLGVLKNIHLALLSSETTLTALLGNTLIHAYGKCARMEDAEIVFSTLPHSDVVSWNALIAGHARQGDFVACLQCYERMKMAGAIPNGVTFLSLICACRHGGLVNSGVEYFLTMSRDHGILPGVEHYVSMVDLLGHAGCFAGIEDLLSTMPMQPSLDLWLCLLSACRRHGKVELGERAFSCAVRLQSKHPAAYVLMWNIYADAGLSDRANELKDSRQRASAWKKPGQTWIEHEQEQHTFWVGDQRHPQHERVYDLLGEANRELNKSGGEFLVSEGQ